VASTSEPTLRADLPWLLLAATGGLAMATGAPPGGITLAIWLGFVPLVIVADRLRTRRARRRFFAGWIGGLGIGLVGFPWIGALLERFAGLPMPVAWLGLFVFSAWTAIPFGIWMVLAAIEPPDWIRRRPRAWAWIWPVVSWIGVSTLWPALFPYTPMIGIAEAPEWMQAAELLGVAGVEAQVVLVGVALARAVATAARRRRVGLGAIAVAIPVASWLLGAWRIAVLDREAHGARVVRFGIVQPNTPLFAASAAEKMARLWVMSRDAETDGAQVIVWPEAGAFPQRTIRPFRRDFDDPSRRVLRVHRTPTIFGAASIEPGDRWEYNTVYAMSATGEITGAFDKVVLVPLGEYVPVLDPDWVRSQIPAVSHNHAGSEPARFEVEPRGESGPEPAIHLGPVVCYEDIFIDFAHDVATQPGGIDAFVNVTIDTWFGATAEPWEHLALAQFRSVEHRVPMVRSVAAGPASVVDHAGRLVASLPVRDPLPRSPVQPEYLVADVKLPRNTAEAPTVFARFGWTFRWWCAAAVLGVVAWAGTRRMRRRSAA
jgi:apolipoprotein N-acyltransferase